MTVSLTEVMSRRVPGVAVRHLCSVKVRNAHATTERVELGEADVDRVCPVT
jgi:hypothetical protein